MADKRGGEKEQGAFRAKLKLPEVLLLFHNGYISTSPSKQKSAGPVSVTFW